MKKDETVLVKKLGESAELTTVTADEDEVYGFLKGKGSITADIVSPALSSAEWGSLD